MKKLLVGGGLLALLGLVIYWSATSGPSMMYGQQNTYNQPMGMMQGSQESIASERDFIELMIPHHKEAIATAQEVLDRGGTTQGMKDLAHNIITSQTKEVEFMKTSYQAWFGLPYQNTGRYQPMMRDLTKLEGSRLDMVFLHDMTMHHMGAISMARTLESYLAHESMGELATAIVVNQSYEIQTMQKLYQEIRSSN